MTLLFHPKEPRAKGQVAGRLIRILASVCALWTLQACVQLHQWQRDKNPASVQEFDSPFPLVWDAVPVVVNHLGLNLVLTDKKEKYFLAEGGSNHLSYGERVVVFVEPLKDDRTRVKVISRRRWTNNVLAKNWEDPILDGLYTHLNQNLHEGPMP